MRTLGTRAALADAVLTRSDEAMPSRDRLDLGAMEPMVELAARFNVGGVITGTTEGDATMGALNGLCVTVVAVVMVPAVGSGGDVNNETRKEN